MDQIFVQGGKKLRGSIKISGAKNAALPILVLGLLSNDTCVVQNVPNLQDINTMKQLLKSLGVEIRFEENKLFMNLSTLNSYKAKYDLVRKMRASILVLGPLLAKFGKAEVSLPGGCAIGSRPVDMHLSALEKMGAKIKIEDGYIKGMVSGNSLKAAKISFSRISVGATENTIMAASLASGTTFIENAAIEPEIDDLIEVLIKMGAKISKTKPGCIEITGVKKLSGFEHTIMPDRIEAGTYAIAAAITGGKLELIDAPNNNLKALIDYLRKIGVNIVKYSDGIEVDAPEKLSSSNLTTEVYPGFPTDLQAQAMALMTISEGVSSMEEQIFENRFMHVSELLRFGANIKITGNKAVIKGTKNLNGAQVMATDLRASSSLVLAGLRAEGETVINRIYHLDRGYENLVQKLSQCGAVIKRVKKN